MLISFWSGAFCTSHQGQQKQPGEFMKGFADKKKIVVMRGRASSLGARGSPHTRWEMPGSQVAEARKKHPGPLSLLVSETLWDGLVTTGRRILTQVSQTGIVIILYPRIKVIVLPMCFTIFRLLKFQVCPYMCISHVCVLLAPYPQLYDVIKTTEKILAWRRIGQKVPPIIKKLFTVDSF